ncbi:MAG: alpha/beta fold hydrolase [Pseudomonadota bacterium]
MTTETATTDGTASGPATTPDAHPVTFDRDGRRLFGWYHPPAAPGGSTRDCVVVMCNPIGYDAVCAHRHYRVLAQQLAQAGFAVLRYDHHGTGDSSGSEEDPQRITAWTNGVARAVAFAARTSGASQVALFGVRMGGTLALGAAASLTMADSIVAWAPFASGNAYLREMRALRMLRGGDSASTLSLHDTGVDMGEEAAGYVLTASTIAALGELNLLTLDKAPAPALLLLARDDLPGNDRLARHLGGLGCAVTQSAAPGYAGMMRDTFVAVVPQEALAEIRAWLETRHPLRPTASVAAVEATGRFLAGMSGSNSSVSETAVRFGADDRLFGIVSEPVQPQGDRARTGVIFVSVGSNLHTGPNRMYVTQARVLASLGFVSMRMDIGGVGESPPAPGRQENQVYALHSVADVLAALRFLRAQHQVEKFVLVGVCSGAYLSFHAAMTEADVASIILVNPQTFTWREGDSLELKRRTGIHSMRFYRSRLFDAGTWKRLVTGQVNLGVILFGMAAVVRKRFALRLAALRSSPASAASAAAANTDIRGIFRGFLQRGVEVFLIFSANDGGLDEVQTHLGQNAAKLRKMEHFKFQIVDGADHTFTPLWAQRRLSDLLAQHVMRLYG